MRITSLVLLLAFGVVVQDFDDPAFVSSLTSPPVTGGVCATSDTAIPHDELLEGFGTPGYEGTWTEIGTTANINDQYDSTALASGKPTGACNTALEIIIPTDTTQAAVRWDRGSSIAVASQVVDLVFYIWVATAPDAGEAIALGGLANTTSGSICIELYLRNSGGLTKISAEGTASSEYITISNGAWHKIKVHSDTTAASSYIQVDDGTQYALTRYSNDVRYVRLGAWANLDAGDSGTFYLDLICLNTP